MSIKQLCYTITPFMKLYCTLQFGIAQIVIGRCFICPDEHIEDLKAKGDSNAANFRKHAKRALANRRSGGRTTGFNCIYCSTTLPRASDLERHNCTVYANVAPRIRQRRKLKHFLFCTYLSKNVKQFCIDFMTFLTFKVAEDQICY